jgi:hypothetical protein
VLGTTLEVKKKKKKIRFWCWANSKRDLCAITKLMQIKKVGESTFLHLIKRCCGILFGLSAQVNMAFIFDINTNLNENNKEMSTDFFIISKNSEVVGRTRTDLL